MSWITTHVLDTAAGRPAAGVPVVFSRVEPSGELTRLAEGVTNADGRVADLLEADEPPVAGVFQMAFDTAAYYASGGPDGAESGGGQESFYPRVEVRFRVTEGGGGHYHVPLLLSPFGYSTYRGS
ncbi:MAG: hydroxyisourate hydrolase [Planctomycetota bacterium]